MALRAVECSKARWSAQRQNCDAALRAIECSKASNSAHRRIRELTDKSHATDGILQLGLPATRAHWHSCGSVAFECGSVAARTSGYGLWRCNDSSPSEYPKMLSLHTLETFLNVNFGTEGQESARWLFGGSEGQECARWRFAVALRAKNVLDGKDHGITTVRPGGCSAGLPARSCLRMPTPNVSKTFIHTSSKRRTNIQEHERIHAHTNTRTCTRQGTPRFPYSGVSPPCRASTQ